MVKTDNLATKLCSILSLQNIDGNSNSPHEWRILGKENNESIIVTWVTVTDNNVKRSHIGVYNPKGKISRRLQTLYTFSSQKNPIQASVNKSRTLLAFVTKETVNLKRNDDNNTENESQDEASDKEKELFVYKPFLVEIKAMDHTVEPYFLGKERSRQIMVQFLYRKSDTEQKVRMLLMIHQESTFLYNIDLTENESGEFIFNGSTVSGECVCRTFSWAQWEPSLQALFYIHYRSPTVSTEGDSVRDIEHLRPTLSGLQFHDDLPHETVLNIPLSLPNCSVSPTCGVYEDDCIPLRVHDCSLDLLILTNEVSGMLCICHHYVYQPSAPEDGQVDTSVHFAYSVTILHHGCVSHCVVPGIPWQRAKTLRPTFAFHGDHHVLILVPDLFTHLLDIGLSHTPCCHIVAGPCTGLVTSHLLLLSDAMGWAVDAATLDLVPLKITTNLLVEAFKKDNSMENRAAILHYFLVHQDDMDTIIELLGIVMSQPLSLDVTQLLQEVLLGGAFTTVRRTLTQEAEQLLKLLPVTTLNNRKPIQTKISGLVVGVSHEVLYSSGVALLAPRQRLQPYTADLWTRLWQHLEQQTQCKPRFQPSQVADKLLVSLVCYQPEALSRCTTPLSPSGTPMSELVRPTHDSLPFLEIESCTASKQEHVISVNLRELSMHLVKHSAARARWIQQPNNSFFNGFAGGSSAGHVHTVATRYAASQLELSRMLCSILCQVVGLDMQKTLLRGFELIDHLSDTVQYELFVVLERYMQAAEALAFPLPQGFSSFFCFLGYRTLSFDTFLQYVRKHVFELQIDVMKFIMSDTEDSREGVEQKLRLLSLLPRSRARRLLANWSHPVSLMLRAREHAMHVLSGEPGAPIKHSQKARGKQLGLAAFPSAERLSPLDTFLDLLTAKASLHELDFNLLIEATITSTENFL